MDMGVLNLKFHDTLEVLKAHVEKTGEKGTWQQLGDQYRFTTPGGAILVWYGRQVGTVMFQGKPVAQKRLEKSCSAFLGGSSEDLMKW